MYAPLEPSEEEAKDQSPSDPRPETFLAHGIGDAHAQGGMVNPPLWRGSTVMFRNMADMETRERQLNAGEDVLWYGRKGTPTTFAVARALATLEGGHRAIITSSGLTACVSAIQAFVGAGDHILVSDSVYGPTRHFVDNVLARFGVQASYYPPLIGAEIAALFRPNTRLVYVESPGSQTFEVQDVPAIADVARTRAAVVVMDNTWATPLYFKPFALPGSPGYNLWKRDFRGASGLFGVIFKPCEPAAFRGFIDHLKLFGLGFSWGGFESLAMPFDPRCGRVSVNWPYTGPALRLHVGLEAVVDLVADLRTAFGAMAA